MSLEWHDWWRLLLLLVATACLFLLGRQFYHDRRNMGEKSRDQWYMLVMWTIAAWEMQFEGLLRDTELRWRLIFVGIALFITLKLLIKKKAWDET